MRYERGWKQSEEYSVTASVISTDMKQLQGRNEVDWKIWNSSQVHERSVQSTDNSKEEAFLQSGAMCFQAFVSSVWWESGEEGMTGV